MSPRFLVCAYKGLPDPRAIEPDDLSYTVCADCDLDIEYPTGMDVASKKICKECFVARVKAWDLEDPPAVN